MARGVLASGRGAVAGVHAADTTAAPSQSLRQRPPRTEPERGELTSESDTGFKAPAIPLPAVPFASR